MENEYREFFMVMKPPTVTAQEKRWRCQNGKPVAYDDKRLLAAREKLRANLLRYIVPDTEPYDKAVELVVKWCFPLAQGHGDGEWYAKKPDTDNLQKMLKDVMTECGFWRDDCLVTSEIVQKFYAEIPGIYVAIREL